MGLFNHLLSCFPLTDSLTVGGGRSLKAISEKWEECLETGPTDAKMQVLKAANRHPSPFARAALAVEARTGLFGATLGLLARDEPEKVRECDTHR